MQLNTHAALPPALSAFLAGRPVEPIGYRKDGRPIFPIAGGAPDDDPDADKDKSKGGDKDKPADKAGDDFKPITSQDELDRRIGPRLERERAKYADYDDLKDKAQKFDDHVEQSRTEQEKAVEAARKEGTEAATSAANTRIIAAEARALAATARFHDPADAVRLLNLKDIKVADDGQVDTDAIKERLEAMATEKPYMVDDGKTRPKPDRSQGGGGGEEKSGTSAGRERARQRHPQHHTKTS